MQQLPVYNNDKIISDGFIIVDLITKYIFGSLAPEEHDQLDIWVATSDENMRLFENLTDGKKTQLALSVLHEAGEEGLKALKKIKKKLQFTASRHSSSFLNRMLQFTLAA